MQGRNQIFKKEAASYIHNLWNVLFCLTQSSHFNKINKIFILSVQQGGGSRLCHLPPGYAPASVPRAEFSLPELSINYPRYNFNYYGQCYRSSNSSNLVIKLEVLPGQLFEQGKVITLSRAIVQAIAPWNPVESRLWKFCAKNGLKRAIKKKMNRLDLNLMAI